MNGKLSKDLELRKVAVGKLSNIAAILEINNDWKKVMSLVPRNPRSEYFEPKYKNEHIKQIEDYARISNRKCADILFEEWGTSGRIRPTLGTLKEVIEKAEVYRAAEELAMMLQEANPKRPAEGPAAPIDTNVTLLMEQNTDKIIGTTKQISDAPKPYPSLGNKTTAVVKPNTEELPDFSAMLKSDEQGPSQNSFLNIDLEARGIDSSILNDKQLIHFPYAELEKITKKFSEKFTYTPGEGEGQGQYKLAGIIGSGGFGDVYVGYHSQYGHLAVKRARDVKIKRRPDLPVKIFNAEVKCSQFRHKNIVSIIGFSIDGPSLCIISEYVEKGSLEQIIEERKLQENQRIDIMVGVAEGIKFLHAAEIYESFKGETGSKATKNSGKSKLVHGDIKSANILLTQDLVPKLCDFGLAKRYDQTEFQSVVIGTSAYMSPEGKNGTITQKVDIYSYGIVLLELLTGQKPIIKQSGETIHIKDYVTENDISTVLDFVVQWKKHKEILDLAKQCLEKDRIDRPSAEEICNTLCIIRDKS